MRTVALAAVEVQCFNPPAEKRFDDNSLDGGTVITDAALYGNRAGSRNRQFVGGCAAAI
jgi:hypothetical protein